MRELGCAYEKGGLFEKEHFIQLVDINLDRAHELYSKAAALGDNLGKNYLGSFYFNHTKEFERAVNLFR